MRWRRGCCILFFGFSAAGTSIHTFVECSFVYVVIFERLWNSFSSKCVVLIVPCRRPANPIPRLPSVLHVGSITGQETRPGLVDREHGYADHALFEEDYILPDQKEKNVAKEELILSAEYQIW